MLVYSNEDFILRVLNRQRFYLDRQIEGTSCGGVVNTKEGIRVEMLNFINYYWRFIVGYSKRAIPLTKLLKE